MKVLKGKYIKESESKERIVYSLSKDNVYLKGIDLSVLSPEEKVALKELVDKFDESVKPFIKKAYRQFKVENFEQLVWEDL
jgi:hypothetical protein